jgi:SAM-dependent methyltransferase
VRGDASALETDAYDLAVMSGHVAQVITDNRKLVATLTSVRRALRPGGRLTFDSRNPVTRCWTQWTPEMSRRTLGNGVEVWLDNTTADGDLVQYEIHYRFPSGERIVSHNALRFRSYAWFKHVLADAGFLLDPMDFDGDDMMFTATAAPPRTAVDLRMRLLDDGRLRATIVYDSTDVATVELTDLDSVALLHRFHELQVPPEMVARAFGELGFDWDVAGEILWRSEADMDDWRHDDRHVRDARKREFRRPPRLSVRSGGRPLQVPAGELGPGGEVGLRQYPPDVTLDGPLGEEQPGGDVPIGQSGTDELDDLALAVGQRILGPGPG